MRRLVTLSILLTAQTSFALPRPNSKVPAGANHHIGDASFVARHGRAPTGHDSEAERMHAHLAYIHDWLAARPATRPELAAKREQILGYLADYVAKGTTPENAHVPWRTPVFIDDKGQICAVGYLIEQSVGRALPEKIAKAHRYDFIEDIAGAMPEVSDWVAASGFTLEEIASIQPAYEEPRVDTWWTWNLKKFRPADGPYDKFGTGTFKRGQMEGAWHVGEVGKGTMKHGAGDWTSFYPDGTKLAEGRYAGNRANGDWKIFYESGRLAAEGEFRRGQRFGRWHFYADDEKQTPIATGKFAENGAVDGTWQHFGADGKLAAISKTETPDQWLAVDRDWRVDGGEGFRLDVVAKPGDVAYAVHEGTVGQSPQRLESFSLGDERLYDHKPEFGTEVMYDQDGNKLEHTDAGWTAANCHWSAARKQAARDNDLARLHGALYTDARRRAHISGKDMDMRDDAAKDEGPTCSAAKPVAAERAARLDALLASRDAVHAVSPQEVRDAVLDGPADLGSMLRDSMTMYIEWPHVDGLFVQLFETLPGRFTKYWVDGSPEQEWYESLHG